MCVPLTQELSPHGGMSPAPACAHLLSSTRFISSPGSRPAMEARTEGVPRLPRRRPSLAAAPARQPSSAPRFWATFLPRRSRLVVGCPCPSSFLVLAEQGSGAWCPVPSEGGPQEAAVTCVHRSVMCPQGTTTGSSSSCAFRFERIVNGLM